MSNLTINNRQVDGVTIVDVQGKIALGDSNTQLHQSLKQLVADGKKSVILNMADVTGIDSSGLGSIVAGYSTLQSAGGSMKLMNLSDRVADIMTITKLYTVFDIYDNETDAVNSFGSAGATAGS